MTAALGRTFDEAVARRADMVTEGAITLLLDGPPVIQTVQGQFQVIIVAAPARENPLRLSGDRTGRRTVRRQ